MLLPAKLTKKILIHEVLFLSELGEGTDCRKSSYLLVKTMVSCKIDMNPLTVRIP
jgi:hypothetical protein